MSLLRFFKQKNGLPDPRGTLSTSVTYTARAQANQEVQKATSSEKQCGLYKKYSAGLRAEISKYASLIPNHGVAAGSRPFSRKLSKGVSKMTVRSVGSAYLEYFTSSCFPYLAINVVATNTAGSSVYMFDRGCHRVLDRSNVRTRVQNND